MKRFFVVMMLCLLALPPRARADGPDDQYVTIYNLIQQGDMYYEKGQTASARAKYEDALSVLKKFQAVYPDWNMKVVKFRLNYLTGKLAELVPPAVAPAPTPAAVPAAPKPTPVVPPLVISGKPEVTARVQVPPSPPVTPTPKAVVPPPAPAAKPVEPSIAKITPPANNPDPQIMVLQDQVRRLEGDRVVLEAKLKEALAARPASVDPRELAQAQELVRELQKENELLKVSLAEARTNLARVPAGSSEQLRLALAEANRKVTQLTEANATLSREKESLQARVKALANPDAVTQALREENEILKKQVADLRSKSSTNAPGDDLNRKLMEAQSQLAVLQSDKELLRLEKMALESRYREAASRTNPAPVVDAATQEKVRKLESQREELQKKLDAALKIIEGHRAGEADAGRIEQMTQELANLHARIDSLEAKPVPYTPEELALFDKPPVAQRTTTNSTSSKRSVRELPASGAVLVAEAKRFYAGGQLPQAEAKYLEILKLNEKNVSTLTDLAEIQVELNHLADAEKHLKSALALEPDNDYSLTVMGRLKYQQTNYDAALESFSRAAQVNPQNPEIENWIGITLSEKGMRGPAEAALRRAVQIDPNYADAHINLAFVYIFQKPPLVELARWHYQKALAAHHPRVTRLEALLDTPRTANATP